MEAALFGEHSEGYRRMRTVVGRALWEQALVRTKEADTKVTCACFFPSVAIHL
jgi:hypothetical protein